VDALVRGPVSCAGRAQAEYTALVGVRDGSYKADAFPRRIGNRSRPSAAGNATGRRAGTEAGHLTL
jgi:hypothetical protein